MDDRHYHRCQRRGEASSGTSSAEFANDAQKKKGFVSQNSYTTAKKNLIWCPSEVFRILCIPILYILSKYFNVNTWGLKK